MMVLCILSNNFLLRHGQSLVVAVCVIPVEGKWETALKGEISEFFWENLFTK